MQQEQTAPEYVQRLILSSLLDRWGALPRCEDGSKQIPCGPYLPGPYHKGFEAGCAGDVSLFVNPYNRPWNFYSFFVGWEYGRMELIRELSERE
jgi:hypothetical protein